MGKKQVILKKLISAIIRPLNDKGNSYEKNLFISYFHLSISL